MERINMRKLHFRLDNRTFESKGKRCQHVIPEDVAMDEFPFSGVHKVLKFLQMFRRGPEQLSDNNTKRFIGLALS